MTTMKQADVSLSHRTEPEPTDSKTSYVNIRVSRHTREVIRQVQNDSAFRTTASTLDWVMQTIERQSLTKPATVEKLFESDIPSVVCGPPGCGKTTFCREKVVPNCAPLLVVDPVGEYQTIGKTSLANLMGLKWGRASASSRLRFIPSSNPILFSAEMTSLFSYLNGVKSEKFNPGQHPSGLFRDWTFLCEEGHRLRSIDAFNLFLLEARKYCKKIILVCSDPTIFGSFCESLRPMRGPRFRKDTVTALSSVDSSELLQETNKSKEAKLQGEGS